MSFVKLNIIQMKELIRHNAPHRRKTYSSVSIDRALSQPIEHVAVNFVGNRTIESLFRID